MRSSLTLEMLLTLSKWYTPLFFVLTIAALIYKGPCWHERSLLSKNAAAWNFELRIWPARFAALVCLCALERIAL